MSSWPRVPMGDLVLEERPQRSESDEPVWNLNLDQIESGSGRVLERVRVPQDDLGPSTYPFEAGTVLYSKLRPYLNKVVVADEPGFATTELVPLRCKPQKAFPSYIAYFLRSAEFLSFANTVVAGAKMPRMVMSEFWKYQVPLPPLDEQRRIAAILDKADTLRTKRREALAQLDRLAQSIFVDMFGDPVRNDKNWPTRSVSEICELVRGSSPRPQGDPKYFGGPIPRLMVADITRDGWLVTPRIDSLTVEGAKRSRPVKAGTVVMAVSGNVGLVSRLAVDACVHDGFVAFNSLDEETCTAEYLLAVLHYSKSRHEKSKAGAIFINLTTTDIKAMDLPIPTLELQRKFSSRLRAVREVETRLAENACLTDALFESVQHRAFQGEL